MDDRAIVQKARVYSDQVSRQERQVHMRCCKQHQLGLLALQTACRSLTQRSIIRTAPIV